MIIISFIVLKNFVQPLSDGYIAIILPKFAEAETVCSHLLSAEEYMLSKNELIRGTSEAIGIQ